MNTPISSNDAPPEDRSGRGGRKRDPESWARELPAPLPEQRVEAACEALLAARAAERRAVLFDHAGEHGAAGRIQIVAALVDRGYALRHSDPQEYVRIAQVASQCAHRHIASFSDTVAAGRQLRVGALGFLANAYRVAELYPQAKSCWERMRRVPPRAEVLRGQLLWFRANLARDLRDFPGAVALFEESIELLRSADAPGLATQALLSLSACHANAGATEAALAPLLEAIRVATSRATMGATGFYAVHNLADLFVDLGRPALAGLILQGNAHRYQAREGTLAWFWGLGVEARTLAALGSAEGAVPLFETVRVELLRRELFYDAAIVGLELALAYLQLHRSAEVRRLAREMYPVFTAHSISREASMVLVEFHDAALEARVDAAFVRGVLARLQELERRPAAV